MKKLLVILFTMCLSECFVFYSNGQDQKTNTSSTSQTEDDKKIVDGKYYLIYHIQSGDTWYSIARKYNISYSELRLANKDKDDKLHPDHEILIPADKLKSTDPFYQKKHLDKAGSKNSGIKYHIVESSQTLYRISKMYGISVDEIKSLNHLNSNTISIGQKLIVSPNALVEENITNNKSTSVVSKKESVKKADIISPTVEKQKGEVEPKEHVAEKVDVKSANNKNDSNNEKVVFANGRYEVNETGVASFLDDGDGSTDKFFALHRTAPIGTVIRVSNIANSKMVYVKIIGQLTSDDGNEDILIKISKASADRLGVTEKSFQANLLYGINKN